MTVNLFSRSPQLNAGRVQHLMANKSDEDSKMTPLDSVKDFFCGGVKSTLLKTSDERLRSLVNYCENKSSFTSPEKAIEIFNELKSLYACPEKFRMEVQGDHLKFFVGDNSIAEYPLSGDESECVGLAESILPECKFHIGPNIFSNDLNVAVKGMYQSAGSADKVGSCVKIEVEKKGVEKNDDLVLRFKINDTLVRETSISSDVLSNMASSFDGFPWVGIFEFIEAKNEASPYDKAFGFDYKFLNFEVSHDCPDRGFNFPVALNEFIDRREPNLKVMRLLANMSFKPECKLEDLTKTLRYIQDNLINRSVLSNPQPVDDIVFHNNMELVFSEEHIPTMDALCALNTSFSGEERLELGLGMEALVQKKMEGMGGTPTRVSKFYAMRFKEDCKIEHLKQTLTSIDAFARSRFPEGDLNIQGPERVFVEKDRVAGERITFLKEMNVVFLTRDSYTAEVWRSVSLLKNREEMTSDFDEIKKLINEKIIDVEQKLTMANALNKSVEINPTEPKQVNVDVEVLSMAEPMEKALVASKRAGGAEGHINGYAEFKKHMMTVSKLKVDPLQIEKNNAALDAIGSLLESGILLPNKIKAELKIIFEAFSVGAFDAYSKLTLENFLGEIGDDANRIGLLKAMKIKLEESLEFSTHL
ncbi:hypothetical protein [Iodobacter fluviatilis]|uniref:Uncharacterized protein n=1 Tax=Iodobacter fluviatilis TaxID=537 RepID=A0A377Q5X8_9NEIS|nr:hypothetical protein [Iodobacter fluviatilis]TCU81190.1 hypothetical protein EV682_12621 [Iodobacter fluviatilis]STQ90168.1 Uncharacterised protein [Iodobacter fluviatilis]